VIADIDITFVDVAAGACKYVGDGKCGSRGRQRDRHIVSACLHRLRAQSWHEIATLLGRRHGLQILGI
jgi:hypothetical protein